MSRPLIVTDCDKVLLHMVAPFRDWLGEQHGIDFAMDHDDFARALRHRESGALVGPKDIWPLLSLLRQQDTAAPDRRRGPRRSLRWAIMPTWSCLRSQLAGPSAETRTRQLADAHGIALRVFTPTRDPREGRR